MQASIQDSFWFHSVLFIIAADYLTLGNTRGVRVAPVVQKVDSAIQRINLYPVDSAIGFPNTYPLASDLSAG